MALTQYKIRRFGGVHQGLCENALDGADSPDACNMETSDGNLSVAKGYVRHMEAALPAAHGIARMYVWNRDGARRFIAVCQNTVYAMGETDTAWRALHTYADTQAGTAQYDFQALKIASTEYLVIASGRGQLVKWDGESETASPFGSEEGLSNMAVTYVELYYNRLFAAGDAEHPARLYWSCAPGDTRTVEQWNSVEQSENVSGGHVEVGTDSDPITGLFALSNQLLIFKKDSLYRLLGDRPSNYRICPVNAAMRQPVHTAVARYGDVLYFLTDGGMYYFDGQSVQRQPDADKVRKFIGGADLSACRAAACRDRLYFAVREHAQSPGNDAVLVYDLAQRSYMVRRGFIAYDLSSAGGVLYLADGNGRVCRFNEGASYDGRQIDAYWNTPLTDLDAKFAQKRLSELYLRGTGGLVLISASAGGTPACYERVMPGSGEDVLEAPLSCSGRAFSLRFSNVSGSQFTIEGGVELLCDVQRRIL